MKLVINIKYILILIIFSLLLIQHCRIPLIGGIITPITYFLITIFLLILPFYLKKHNNVQFDTFIQTKSFKIYCLLIIWVLGFKLIFALLGIFNFKIFYFLFGFVLPFFIFSISIPDILNFKQISKLLIIGYLLIFILGFLEYIGYFYKIHFLQDLFKIIVNQKLLIGAEYGYGIYGFGVPRPASVFLEPSYYAFFLVVNAPIIYHLCSDLKNKIFSNHITDKLLKISAITFGIISLILTQSPIFISIGTILLTILLLNKSRKYIFNVKFIGSLIILTSLLFLILLNSKFDTSNNFLSRITIIFENMNNFSYQLIYLDQSLATRIINYINYFIIFLKHPIFGVGIGNLIFYLADQLQNSPVPLTPELTSYIYNKNTGGASILFAFLAEIGIIGTSLFYLLLLNLLYSANKIIPFYKGTEQNLLKGLKYFLMVFMILTIYDSEHGLDKATLYFGLIQGFVLNKMIKEKEISKLE